MEMVSLSLPATNRFATNYLEQTAEIQRYFHYSYQKPSDFKKRLLEIRNRSFMRNELAGFIEQYMAKFPTSNEVTSSIKKLTNDDCVVVIGGQQAGILTGPLYTIHKIISIIHLAKQKEDELGIPVVPVFWIAGEDHDYQEINHIYLEKNHKMEKIIYPEKIMDKKMSSDIPLDKEVCLDWLKNILEHLGETEYTKDLLAFFQLAIQRSTSFVDFFAYVIMELFKDQGLLIVDSGDPELRSLEKEILLKQIKSYQIVTDCVKKQQAELGKDGFVNVIEISEHACNLFYYDEVGKERVLLLFDKDKQSFVGKSGNIEFSFEDLLFIAENHPEKLSNNVVTRPITQEWLFPTLAFIGGPGEIAYWAELKKAFEAMDMKMPPIVPRLNITLLERSIDTDLNELDISLEHVLRLGVGKELEQFLRSVSNKQVDELLKQAKSDLMEQYQMIEELLMNEDRGILPLLMKNKSLIAGQIDFIKGKIEDSVKRKHEVTMNKYKRVENSLKPIGSPQERLWNSLYFMNKYGMHFVHELLKLEYAFDGKHYVVKI
ncbi:bacillithiol biosynthesis cysteine-adding enzyme BshC [Bacillus sp. 03113]|uniref:bacillithiol biosynthesis cysteine-adding enzyme BshC n=1 Tax=Bacillus sp. 03113 TaxID=2578211 RepID=UPI00114494AC|nr:bacillithiol biosynthesis cysteine-adding enzyme BshC [Bacillus sp. 03113]